MSSSPEEAVRRVLAAHCQLTDDRDLRAADLFTTGATYISPYGNKVGRDQIRESLRERFASDAAAANGRHLAVQSVIDVDGDTARAVSDMLFVEITGKGLPIRAIARYEDRFVREDGHWLIAERRFCPAGIDSPGVQDTKQQ